jgi:hypothetical protein
MEILMAVSYYFDSKVYAHKDVDFDPADYIAGGVACWDLEEQRWLWTVHLDLTTDKTKFKALIHGSPTVVDLDGDGRYEVVIGTSLGLLYVLDGDTGTARRHFPMQFNEIQCTVAVADITGGSHLEMIVADMGGNLVVVDLNGEVLWDIQLTGSLPFTPTVGDVNGDGAMDIVVVAVTSDTSHLYAIDGTSGKPLPNFPIVLPLSAMISSPVTIVDLHDYYRGMAMTPTRFADPALPPWMQNSRGHSPAPAPSMDILLANKRRANMSHSADSGGKNLRRDSRPVQSFSSGKIAKGLHLLVPSFDGHLYIIDGVLGCAERVDVGEHIYSVPLVDDVTGDGLLDIVIGTMNGHLMVMETTVPYHPLNAWASFPKHRLNGFTHGAIGISIPFAEGNSLKNANMKGEKSILLTFDIWDNRVHVKDRSFKVFFSRGTNRAEPILEMVYDSPGRYTVNLPVSPPDSMTLVIGMINEHGQYYEDTAHVAVGTKFYVWLKYLILGPLLIIALPFFLTRRAVGQSVYFAAGLKNE